jgi:hypothetical protein
VEHLDDTQLVKHFGNQIELAGRNAAGEQ